MVEGRVEEKMTEREKMKLGLWYDANNDQELLNKRVKAMDLCFELNQLKPSLEKQRQAVLNDILGYLPEGLVLLSPFVCDYGTNIEFGKDVFVNVNSYFMDGAKIKVGNNVYIGPSCGFYTANHPLQYSVRNTGLEQALPITIGNNVWMGGNVTVLPGVTIGDGCVIGAGSVVTKDIEENSLACGTPCKVIKKIDNKDQ